VVKMKMADVSMKFETIREAQAEGKIYLSKETIELIKNKQIPKGDVITASQMAGLIGAKKTSEVLPFCHPILIDQAYVDVILEEDGIYVKSFVRCIGRTGVEMEALTAVSAALLNVYDMCKAFDKNMVISDIKLVSKKGGKSDYEEDLSGLNCAVITLSDSCYRKEAEDKSGKIAIDIIENEFGGKVIHYEILPDEKDIIVNKLKDLVDKVDIIFTTGGTGFSREITLQKLPEKL
jgi:molybdenum cofactor biosynthesis protein MoaC